MQMSELKILTPRSLFSRTALIVIVPIIALQLIVAFVFIQRHYEGVTRQMTRNIAREIAVAQQVIDTSPTAAIAQLRLTNLSIPLAIPLDLLPASGEGEDQRHWYDLSGRALIEEMRELLGPDVRIDLIANRRTADVRLPTDKGVLQALIPRRRVAVSNPHQLLVLMISASIILITIAFLFLRNQIRPINQLADVSEAFGKGRSDPFRPAGAEEVRRAGNAFLSMRSRIERQIEQRTQMLTGVSHDLRTPLTRMKLSLALMDDPEAEAMLRDVTDMEVMLDAFLAFARGDQAEEMVEALPAEIAADLAAQAERGGIALDLETHVETPDAPIMRLRHSAVCRAVQNLINNAAHYGTKVKLTLRLLPKTCEFIVEDNGPGIPGDQRDKVTRPFVRLDESRNLNKGGGVGLGLSIAQDVARSHGGALELGESPMGGLRAVIRLPR